MTGMGAGPHVGLGSDGVDAVKSGLVAFCFPGQGSLAVGMGREIAAAVPEAMEVFERGSEAAGLDLQRPLLRGARGGARRDRGAAARARRHEPRRAGGGARARDQAGLRRRPLGRRVRRARRRRARCRVEEAIALVRERGLAMAEAARRNPGSMAAILGLDDEVVERICRRILNVWPANYNCPGQIVVSGENPAVDEACDAAEQEGARRAVKLRVSGAFHSPLVARAADRLRPALERVKFVRAGRRRSCRP